MNKAVNSIIASLLLLASSAASANNDGGKAAYAIAFASFAPLNRHLYVADADGSHSRPLLGDSETAYNASFSPDGRWIVFTSERAGSADIYRVHRDGTGREALVVDPAFDDQAALSPDGRSLAFVSTRSGSAHIWTMDVASRRLVDLTPGSDGNFRPAWSPDGRSIAFTSDRDSAKPKFHFVTVMSTEVYVVGSDGSGLKRLTHEGALVGSPSWSGDGLRLAAYEATIENVRTVTGPQRLPGTSQVVTVDVGSGAVRAVTAGPGEKWSPQWTNTERIGYVSGGTAGGVEFTTGAPGERGQFRDPKWSRDGKELVFDREIPQPWPPLQPAPSRDERFRLVRTGIFPSYSASGDRLVCSSSTAGTLHNDLLMMKADGTQRSTFFHDDQRSALGAVWSRRDDRIAFSLGGSFQMIKGASIADIVVVRSDGSGRETLTNGMGNASFPSWSPDGREIVFRSATPDGSDLSIVDVRTHAIRPLTSGGHHDNFPSWSPLGDRIVFSRLEAGDYEIFSIRPDGTGLERLTNERGNDAHPSYSPDGAWIAFASARAGFKDESFLHPYNPQPYGAIYVMRADGSDVRMLTENSFENATPSWLPIAPSVP